MYSILFSALLLLLSNHPVMAEGGYVPPYQGIISSTGEIPRYIVVNESKLFLDEGVIIKDHHAKEGSLSNLRAGKWIYIAAEKRPAGVTALRIYLLPGHIKDKEKIKYPFMKQEEEPEE